MSDRDLVPDETPWGHKDHEGELFEGFTFVSTPGHGGLYLTHEQRKAIPDGLKACSADGEGIWWEEDCAWSLPVICLLSARPEHSLSDQEEYYLEVAHELARDYYPDEWENLTKREIKPGESSRRDEQNHLIEHKDNWLVRTAWSSGPHAPWVPEGMVGVCTHTGRDLLAEEANPTKAYPERFFLVPQKEYGPGHFVVDPARHQEVTGRDGVPPAVPAKKQAEPEKPQERYERLAEKLRSSESAAPDHSHNQSKDKDRQR